MLSVADSPDLKQCEIKATSMNTDGAITCDKGTKRPLVPFVPYKDQY